MNEQTTLTDGRGQVGTGEQKTRDDRRIYDKLMVLVNSGIESIKYQMERWHPSCCAVTLADTNFYLGMAEDLAKRKGLLQGLGELHDAEDLFSAKGKLSYFESRVTSSPDGREQLRKAWEWIAIATIHGYEKSSFVPH